MTNPIGQSLGRYHILEQLGEGGMATVYKAYDTRLECDVAVKVISTVKFTQEAVERALKRFEREAKALARLTHPNIVKVTDYGEYEGQPYLVMEFLPGGNLKQHLKEHAPLPWQEATRLLMPIAQALEFAHSQGVIHRDVKPSNILLTQNGQPMLTDFGVAKVVEEEATLDLTGTAASVGTPEYMAPEQTGKHIDHRVDIYALGIVFYEIITGRRPFEADTPLAVIVKQASEPLPRPSQFMPGLPEAVEKVMIKALAKKPDDRYQSMGDFAKALEGLVMAPQQSTAKSPSKKIETQFPMRGQSMAVPQKRPAPPPESRKIWHLVAGGAAVLGILGVGIMIGRTLLNQPQQGLSPTITKSLLSPSAMKATSNLHVITTGVNHTCMLTVGGGVKCWGWNNGGQLGDGTNDDSSIPVDVRLLSSGVQAIAAGQDHTCAVTFGGGVKCWGWNNGGQLGDRTNDNSSIPMDVSELDSGIQAIGAGVIYTCALTTKGGVKCWGWNGDGQLGDGTDHNSSKPVDVNGLGSGVQAISVGNWHTCALTSEGGVKCWGSNGDGELGDGTKHRSSTPVDVSGLSSGVQAIAAGGSHTCALTTDGGVKCWGSNWGGQLGNGSNINAFMPVDVSGLSSSVQAIATGRSHSCALTAEGGVKCWGWNGDGQLGDGTNHSSSTPVDVSGLGSGVWTIATGGRHTCALAEGSVAMCWGWNGYGQLGDGTDATSFIPVSV